MARTPIQTHMTQHIITDDDTPGLPTMADAVNYLAVLDHEANQNAVAVAKQLGYDGQLTVGALEDEIRFYQRRTVEGVLELGKRLVLLQELSPHGEFQQRIQMLGMDKALAYKFMKATMKFSKVETFPLLKVGTQSKLLELLVLDDGEIEALESGESVRGVTLDKIETMSVSELKRALRDARENALAKDRVISDKTAELNKKAEKLALLENSKRTDPPIGAEQRLLDARANLQIAAANIKATVMTSLRKYLKDLHEHPGDHSAFAAGCLIEISRELAILRDDYNLPSTVSEDTTPDWMNPEIMAAVEKQYAGLPSVGDVLSEE